MDTVNILLSVVLDSLYLNKKILICQNRKSRETITNIIVSKQRNDDYKQTRPLTHCPMMYDG